MKWANWDGPNTWVNLTHNPELRDLCQNKANPHSCTLHDSKWQDESNVMALRQAIFDSLDEVRYTGDVNMGRQSRVSVKIPFSKDEFDKKFRKQGNENIPDNDCGNVECYITGEELTKAIGEGWNTRNYKTSTETFVSFKEYIHLSWGYKPRFQYDHSACQRCVRLCIRNCKKVLFTQLITCKRRTSLLKKTVFDK